MAQLGTVRVLVVDAEPGLIEDYRMALCPDPGSGAEASPDALEADPIVAASGQEGFPDIELTARRETDEAIAALEHAVEQQRPFGLAIIDPRGPEGLEAVARLRAVDPDLGIVVVSAAPDIDAVALSQEVPPADRLLYLRKPFHAAEIRQLVLALSARARREPLPGDGDRTAARQAELPELPPAGILVFDAGDRLTAASRTMAGLFPELAELFVPGTRYQEIQWQLAKRLLPDDTLYRVHAWVRDRLDWHAAGGGVLEQRLRGSRWILLAEARGAMGETFCHFHDVTALKRHELRRSAAACHAQLSQAFAGLCDGLGLDPQAPPARPTGGTVVSLRAEIEEEVRSAAAAAVLPGKAPLGLVGRLLSIAQRQKLLPRAVDLNSAMTALVQDLAGEVPAAIEIEVVAAPGLSPVLADPDGLAAALRELVRNACEAMAEGGRLTLEAANVRRDQDRLADARGPGYAQPVRLSVRDSGTGMSTEFAERAVAPFFTTKNRGVHAGLGLAAVYGFLSQSGGRMEFTAGESGGTSVDLYFPRAAVSGGARELVARAAHRYAQAAAPTDD